MGNDYHILVLLLPDLDLVWQVLFAFDGASIPVSSLITVPGEEAGELVRAVAGDCSRMRRIHHGIITNPGRTRTVRADCLY